jgi:outer membrane autotransporter protein
MPNYTPKNWFECDVMAVTKAGYLEEYEIKLSASDFKADSKKCFREGYLRGSDNGVAYNVGLDLAVSKNVNLGLGYMRMNGNNGNHANYTTLSFGYKF